MGLPAKVMPFTRQDFLAWESEQSEKHEYLAGEVFAMSGASRKHVTVALNCASFLSDHLAGGPCRVYISDMKLEVEAADAIFYPDVMVSCDAADRRAEHVLRAPIVIIEVLSPSTAAFDRGGKFQAYRRLASLREYVLIDPDARQVELYRREMSPQAGIGQGCWFLVDIAPSDPVPLISLGVQLPWARVFRHLED